MMNNPPQDSTLVRLQEDVLSAPSAAQLEQSVQASDARFVAAVLDTVGALVVVLDRAGRIVRFNRACERLTGYTSAEVLQRCVWDLFLLPEEVEPVKAVFNRLRAGDFPLNFENYWVTRSGERRLIAWANTTLTTDDGGVDYVIGTGIDITEQRAAECEIKHMSSFPQLNPNPVLEVDTTGAVLFCNPATLHVLQQLGVEPVPRFFVPPDLPAILAELEKSQAASITREVQVANACFAETLSRPAGFQTIRIFTTNITQRKQAEEQLRFQAFLLENIFDAIIATDLDFHILMWNKAAEEIYGWQADEVIGKRGIDVLQSQLMEPRAEVMRQLYEAGHWKGEVIHQCKDGHKVHILASSRLLRSAAGVPIGIVSANRDITDRKRVEEALRESEQQLRLVLDNSRDGINLLDLKTGRYVFMSPAQVELTGFSAEEILNISAEETYERVHPDDREISIAQQKLVAAGQDLPAPAEYRWKVKSGEYRWFSDNRKVIRDEQGQPIALVGVSRDITDRKQAEAQKGAALEALRLSEERYALAQRAANIGSWDWNISTGQLHWSDRLEPLFGIAPGEFGGTHEAFLDCVHPADRQAVIDAVNASIETGQDYAIEHRIVWPSGEVHWIAEIGDVFRDEHGRAVRMLGVARDVTERRQFLASLQESNAELQVRNEELNAFAHSVAHDIKNPLQLIIASAELLNDQYSAQLPEDARLPLEFILKSGCKLNIITDSLLLLSEVSRSEIQLESLRMGAIVAETRQRLGSQLNGEIELCIPDAWPAALGYAPWIEEVWSNLLINAVKYAGRPLRIELGGERLPTGMSRFWVRDNGVGISPAIQAKLFTTGGYTPGPRRRGHGLGLSIVRRIVEKLGGEVGVRSSGVPGEGCEFSFTLPAA